MAELLLELYSEEIPPQLQIGARTQLKEFVENSFKENEIKYKDLSVYSSPTRLVLLANDLAETQANPKKKVTTQVLVAKYASYLALISCAYLGVMSYATENIDLATTWLLLPTLIYFVTATYAMLQQDKN